MVLLSNHWCCHLPLRAAQFHGHMWHAAMCSPHFLTYPYPSLLASQPHMPLDIFSLLEPVFLDSQVCGPLSYGMLDARCSQLLLFLKCLSGIPVTPLLTTFYFPNKALFGKSPNTLASTTQAKWQFGPAKRAKHIGIKAINSVDRKFLNTTPISESEN